MLTYRNKLVGIDPVTRKLIAVSEENDELNLLARLARDGFVIVRDVITSAEVAAIMHRLEQECIDDGETARVRRGTVFGRRNLLDLPVVRELIASPALQSLVETLLGSNAQGVRAILFDKTP